MRSLEPEDKLIRLLLARLERISVDSHWAHRASGVRGALLKDMDQRQGQGPLSQDQRLEMLIKMGFDILDATARERTK
jgi:hypothetical protein